MDDYNIRFTPLLEFGNNSFKMAVKWQEIKKIIAVKNGFFSLKSHHFFQIDYFQSYTETKTLVFQQS